MGRPGVLVHIGYHKTGTTWLQQRLFVTAPLASPFRRRDIGHDFVSVNAFLFDAQVLAEKYAAAFRPVLATGDVPVLSHERLSGNPHSGGYDSRSIADRLRATCPDARILIVIREQRAMLQSVYKQYVHEGGPMSCEQYTTPPRDGSMRVPLYRPEFFEYHHLIAYYQQLFSRDEPDAFIAAIGRNLGV